MRKFDKYAAAKIFAPALFAPIPNEEFPEYIVDVKDGEPTATPFRKKYNVFPDLPRILIYCYTI